jgi:ribosomal protein L7/L12
MIATLKEAKKCAEGRGLPVEVLTKSDAEHVKLLIKFKVEN